MENVGHCTGVLVAPTMMLTAAHCMVDRRTKRFIGAGQIHALLGYDRGSYTKHAIATGYQLAATYRPGQPGDPFQDIAVLHFDAAVGASAIPLAAEDARPGQAVMLGGYGQDRPEAILADDHCTVTAHTDGAPALLHDCAATSGTSGGPVFARGDDGKWQLVGVNVAAFQDHRGGAAIPASIIRTLLAQ